MKHWAWLLLTFTVPLSSPMACGGDGCLRNSDCSSDETCRAGRCELENPPAEDGGIGGEDSKPMTAGGAATAGDAATGGRGGSTSGSNAGGVAGGGGSAGSAGSTSLGGSDGAGAGGEGGASGGAGGASAGADAGIGGAL